MCNFPEDLIDEKTECTSQAFENTSDSECLSPRTKSFSDRFELEPGEILVKTYTCALQKRIVLQGRIYVTSKRICFYSMFNKNTIFFGESTRVNIPFENIVRVKKSRTMGIFKNAIEITVNSGKVIRFTSLLKRTKLYHIILELMRNYEEILDVRSKVLITRNSDIPKHSKLLDELDSFGDAASHCELNFDIAQDLQDNYDEICRNNEEKLKDIDEEFLPKNLSAFSLVSEEVFKGVNLDIFYKKIYGDHMLDDNKTFYHGLIERFENSDIIEFPHDSNISGISFYDPLNINQTNEDLWLDYSKLKSSTYAIEYSHVLHEFMAPPSWNVREEFTSYFVSPVKVHILKRVYNSGFPYSKNFIPMSLITLEQIVDSDGISVKQTISNWVKFIKSVMFFESKIKKNALSEMESNICDVMIPLIRTVLQIE